MDIQIDNEDDLIVARKLVRETALKVGLGLTDTTRLVTAASELGRNILQYAGQGTMYCSDYEDATSTGVEVIFSDQGPGIPDMKMAMEAGFSTSSTPSLGLGLPGARRLVDQMEVASAAGQGTTIKIRKCRTRNQFC